MHLALHENGRFKTSSHLKLPDEVCIFAYSNDLEEDHKRSYYYNNGGKVNSLAQLEL